MGTGNKSKVTIDQLAYLFFDHAYTTVNNLFLDEVFLEILKRISNLTELSEEQVLDFKNELLIFALFLINLESKFYFDEKLESYQKLIKKLSSVLYEKVKEIYQNKIFIVNYKKLNINPYEAFDLDFSPFAKELGLLEEGFSTGSVTYFGILAPVRDRQYFEVYSDTIQKNSDQLFSENSIYQGIYNFMFANTYDSLVKEELFKREWIANLKLIITLLKNMLHKTLEKQEDFYNGGIFGFILALFGYTGSFRRSIVSFLKEKIEIIE